MPDRFKDTDFNGGVFDGGVTIEDGNVAMAEDLYVFGLNRTWYETIWAERWHATADAGSGSTLETHATGSQYGRYWAMANNTTNRIVFSKVMLPPGYGGEPLKARFMFSSNGASTADMAWRIRTSMMRADGSFTSNVDDDFLAPPIGENLVAIAERTMPAPSFESGLRYMRLMIQGRNAGTNADIRRFIGLHLEIA